MAASMRAPQNCLVAIIFVNDACTDEVLQVLAEGGTKLIALRCAGFNNVDLAAAQRLGFTVVNVPSYSPYAVAEHAMALALALNRKIHKAYNRVREGNFSLRGLLGFDFFGRTAGVIGTGKIGEIMVQICRGFGMRVLAYDVVHNKKVLAQRRLRTAPGTAPQWAVCCARASAGHRGGRCVRVPGGAAARVGHGVASLPAAAQHQAHHQPGEPRQHEAGCHGTRGRAQVRCLRLARRSSTLRAAA
jgi:hypothetical protein